MSIKNVRLNSLTIEMIKKCFKLFFKKEDALWIFGSRVDHHKKGGDIDLYIETHIKDASVITEKKIKFLMLLKKNIGDQKIDVIIRHMGSDFYLPIYAIAKNEGVRII